MEGGAGRLWGGPRGLRHGWGGLHGGPGQVQGCSGGLWGGPGAVQTLPGGLQGGSGVMQGRPGEAHGDSRDGKMFPAERLSRLQPLGFDTCRHEMHVPALLNRRCIPI